MALTFTNTVKAARADTIDSQIGSAGKLIIYGGTAPADVSGSVTGNQVLATLNWSGAFKSTSTNGVLTANAPGNATASAGGAGTTATFFRIYKSDGTTAIMQGSVSDTGGSGDLKLNSASISTGATVSVTSFVITEGN